MNTKLQKLAILFVLGLCTSSAYAQSYAIPRQCGDYIERGCCGSLEAATSEDCRGIEDEIGTRYGDVHKVCCTAVDAIDFGIGDGSTGGTGSSGSVGRTGTTGSAGSVGRVGTTGSGSGGGGSAGTVGRVGSLGVVGRTGTTGSNGTVGSTGSTGSTGSVGTTGRVGSTGATGSVGGTGSIGGGGGGGSGNSQPIPCAGHAPETFHKIDWSLGTSSLPTISGSVPYTTTISFCWMVNGTQCTENSWGSGGCLTGLKAVESFIARLKFPFLHDVKSWKSVANGSAQDLVLDNRPNVLRYQSQFPTTAIPNSDYWLRGAMQLDNNEFILAAEPTTYVKVSNGSTDTGYIPPSAPCRTVTLLRDNPFSETGEKLKESVDLCYLKSESLFYSKNCSQGKCSAFKNILTKNILELSLKDQEYVPFHQMCDLLGGNSRLISFLWDSEMVQDYQCLFAGNDSEPSSFFSPSSFMNRWISELYPEIPSNTDEVVPPPTTAVGCDGDLRDAKCNAPLVCQNGTTSVACQITPSSTECNKEDEHIGSCFVGTGTFIPPKGSIVHKFSDRTYPSGEATTTNCWATVEVACAGTPNNREPWYGTAPTPQCINAIQQRNRSYCQACNDACMDSCSAPDEGPCVTEYPGYGDSCGACQYRCEQTYKSCLGV